MRQEVHNDSTNLKSGDTVDQQTSLTNITSNGILEGQAETFDEIEDEWLEALGITDQDETDSEYASSSESSNKDDYEGGDYGDEECTNDCVIDDWVAYLEGILDHDNIDKDIEVENTLFFFPTYKSLKKGTSVNGTKKSGYYRDKERHKTVCAKICEAYSSYITRDMLRMLHHSWSTQKNESLNKNVSSYAPKDRIYPRTNSLDTIITITGAIQIVGYHQL